MGAVSTLREMERPTKEISVNPLGLAVSGDGRLRGLNSAFGNLRLARSASEAANRDDDGFLDSSTSVRQTEITGSSVKCSAAPRIILASSPAGAMSSRLNSCMLPL